VERNTVWRDMAAMERKYAAVSVKQAAAPGLLRFRCGWRRRMRARVRRQRAFLGGLVAEQ
jgi:hypothetical protein